MITKESIAAPQEASMLPPNKPINRDRYALRIKDAVFGDSKSSGNPMITVDVEIFDPPKIKHHADGQEYEVAGLSTKLYFSKSEKTGGDYYSGGINMGMIGRPNQLGFLEVLGLPAALDPENPDVEQLKGKCFSAVVTSDKRTQNKDLTPEDIAAGKKVGEPITDEEGNPMVSYGIRISGNVGKTNKKAPEGF